MKSLFLFSVIVCMPTNFFAAETSSASSVPPRTFFLQIAKEEIHKIAQSNSRVLSRESVKHLKGSVRLRLLNTKGRILGSMKFPALKQDRYTGGLLLKDMFKPASVVAVASYLSRNGKVRKDLFEGRAWYAFQRKNQQDKAAAFKYPRIGSSKYYHITEHEEGYLVGTRIGRVHEDSFEARYSSLGKLLSQGGGIPELAYHYHVLGAGKKALDMYRAYLKEPQAQDQFGIWDRRQRIEVDFCKVAFKNRAYADLIACGVPLLAFYLQTNKGSPSVSEYQRILVDLSAYLCTAFTLRQEWDKAIEVSKGLVRIECEGLIRSCQDHLLAQSWTLQHPDRSRFSRALYNLGNAYEQTGKIGEAIHAYECSVAQGITEESERTIVDEYSYRSCVNILSLYQQHGDKIDEALLDSSNLLDHIAKLPEFRRRSFGNLRAYAKKLLALPPDNRIRRHCREYNPDGFEAAFHEAQRLLAEAETCEKPEDKQGQPAVPTCSSSEPGEQPNPELSAAAPLQVGVFCIPEKLLTIE